MTTSGEPARLLTAPEIFALIQEAAYYKAESRGFAPGYEERDWLEAEAEIRLRLQLGGAEASREAGPAPGR